MSTVAPPFPPPGFRRFWTGEAVSGFGTSVTLLALQTLVVLDLGGGAAQVGWVTSARWLPYLVAGLAVGALVDRVRRRRPVMVTSDLVRAAVLLAIPGAWFAGVLTLPLLVVVVACLGAASLVNDAASMSYLPRIVPRVHLQRAHAWTDGADAVSQTAGPALAGVLVRVIGAPVTIAISAVGYAFEAIAVATTRVPEPVAGAPAGVRHLRREIADGVRWVYGPSGLRVLAIATHTWFAGHAVVLVVLAPYALTTLGLSPAVFGITTAVAGLGALAGATTSSAVGRRLGTGGAVIAAHVVAAVGVLVLSSAVLGEHDGVPAFLLGAGQGLYGYAMGMGNSHEMSWRQAITPDELQARVNTTMRSFNRAVLVVASPVAGLLADRFGLAPALVAAAVVLAVVVAMLAASPFRRARLDGSRGGAT